ncbi:MAG TPA: ABC transporter substrate-binding protein [Spirochaetota bacterium]|nr:ABC transporter substrate-binding protein [Spirochaetota bacterium]
MKSKLKKAIYISLLIIASVIIYFGYNSGMKREEQASFVIGTNPNLPTLTLYTSSAITTPQLAFWAAVNRGEFSEHFNLIVRLYRSIDEIQNLMLAGKGDIWIAHTGGFAMAFNRGAPVTVAVITAWKKFYIVTSDATYHSLEDLAGKTVAYSPPGSPGFSLFKNLVSADIPDIRLQAYHGRELQMLLLNGKVETAILPEPIVSMMLIKNSKLRIVGNMEELYGKKYGLEPLLPLAGIGFNRLTAEKYPGIANLIQDSVVRNSKDIQSDKKLAISNLPDSFRSEIPEDVAVMSLERDVILARPAYEVYALINDYLSITIPDYNKETSKISDKEFLWQN